MPLAITVIVTTYNRPDALAATLRGLASQVDKQFEVIIADDGSTGETADFMRDITPNFPVPLHHVWHADQGFRAAAICNRAIEASTGDYIVLMDGDCIPRPCFVCWHRRLAQPGWMVGGTRLLLAEEFTRQILEQELPVHLWKRHQWIKPRFRGWTNRMLPMLFSLPDGRWRCRRPHDWRSLRTFSMAVHREDLLKVNGLDEAFTGWGSQDSDLIIRLMHAGVRVKSGRHASPVLHLWHPDLPRDDAEDNREELEAVLHSHRIRARTGISDH
ncbi:MAG: glycosyltransferase family 2 protein [Planctomycetota bacterium]|nr:glycosyltransferase family 2 protein [Planctomycetota bacterium]